LGWDHMRDSDAKKMEAEEISILHKLGYPNPYLSQDTQSP
jgi:probable rRNA maturation factor